MTELMRDRGVPAARCAFYRIEVNVGAGFEYWGLYTLIEDPADGAMLDSQLGGRGGNLYKPDGPGATWRGFDAESFPKKSNKREGDWSDIQAAIAALHADRGDAVTWRAGIEATFDVDLFLQWLAVNTVIFNWDAYGVGAHNYYLYAPPGDAGRLGWIPWDHNLAMSPDIPPPPGLDYEAPATPEGEVFHHGAGADWPLIGFLLDDEIYAARYREAVERALEGLFAEHAARARLGELHALVSPHVVGADGEQPGSTTIISPEVFAGSVDALMDHIHARHELTRAALDHGR